MTNSIALKTIENFPADAARRALLQAEFYLNGSYCNSVSGIT